MQNRKYEQTKYFKLAVVSGKVMGDPAASGQIVGVCVEDRDSDGNAMCQLRGGVFTLTCKGIDGSGNSAIAVGDALYYVAGDTPNLSKKATGILFGYALTTLTTGSTGSVDVMQYR